MKKITSILLVISCSILLFDCPSDEPKPSDKRIPLTDNIYIHFPQYSWDTCRNSSYNVCAPYPILCNSKSVNNNIGFSLRKATKEEIPNQYDCKTMTYNFIPNGSTLIVDVGYYSKIKTVMVQVSEYCSGTNIIGIYLIDVNDKIIEEKHLPETNINFFDRVFF